MKKLFQRIFKIFLFVVVLPMLLLLFVTAIFMNISPQFGRSPQGEDLKIIQKSKNYQENQFINLIETQLKFSFKDMVELSVEFWNAKNLTPSKKLPNQASILTDDSLAAVTWFGHSAVLLQIDQKKILFDPMFGKYAAPVPLFVERFETQNSLNWQLFEKIDAVIISHDHYDHLDYESILKLDAKTEHFFVPLGVGSHLRHWGIKAEKITELDWWQGVEFKNLKVTATPSRHFSGRGLTRNQTLWASWVVEGQKQRIFFSGDSGYGNHFREIGFRFGEFDLVMMECGQYNPKWSAIHMLPEESVLAHLDLNGKYLMPIHWGAFRLAIHEWTEPVERIQNAAQKNAVELLTPSIGERFVVGRDFPKTAWWKGF